jgi:hypothetical protein
MSGTALLQLHLLGRMRAARALVDSALETLGVGRDALSSAANEIRGHGLEVPGHPMQTYRRLIGEPLLSEQQRSVDPYQEITVHYILPLWPQFRFSVFGNQAGQTAGVRFTSMPNAKTVESADSGRLGAWEVVEDQVRGILTTGRIVDEWYPQRDYEVSLRDRSNAAVRCVLRFDFNLLQDMILL